LAITPTIADLEARLEAIDAAIDELLTVPLEGTVGRTRIGMTENIRQMRIQRGQIIASIRAAKMRQGKLRPASREVY
jgi:hypothetical protein